MHRVYRTPPVLLWLPHEVLPREDNYVRINATKCHDWKVLACKNVMNGRLLKKEQQQHAEWLSKQPPAVERRAYTRPAGILRRDDQVFNDTTNAFDGGVNIPIECNHDERTPTEVSRAHDTKNNALLNDATATGRNSANTTSVGKLCSATCTGGDSGCFDL